MHASLESSSALPYAQMVGKKDAVSQTDCCRQVTTTNGRAVSCPQPSPSDCHLDSDNSIRPDKSLSDYGVHLAREALQAGLHGSNKLLGSVAGFALQHLMKSGQFPGVFPDIKQSLMFLAAMPALAGAYPLSGRPAYPDGSPGGSTTYSRGPNAGASYTPSFTSSTTHLNTTSEPASSINYLDMPLALGSFVVLGGGLYGFVYCAHLREIYKRIKYDYPEASCCQVIKAVFKYPNYNHTDNYPLPSHVIRRPAPPAQAAPVPAEPTTREQGTQTARDQGTQTEPVIDEPAPQGQPPTYAEAITFSVR
ncbi:hypothetical protein [Endozoicomonas sp. GU-1]|uniref:hypothetical protein n=1 Tax=Endozoicomonas sp. GU-1 TaxID=3009078 RepID=UPI0022B37D9E|nr:hypothetical protein [Endozoicomonas sp. GU-1]WBA82646.1 hypothetical protein O2T12_05760 [Endozoicomonas sp. GU-1]WBA85575.1 hypothetical protein O3276_20415 [Endozoicomonas sp. GU-1]